ncbi:unknown [Candidatus Apopatosoma intestinale]|nr:unknown [Candidatus Apopatosoma intestinale]
MPHVGIHSTQQKQFFVISRFDYFPVFHNENSVSHPTYSYSVRYDKSRLFLCHIYEIGKYIVFNHRIKCTCRLVKNKYIGISENTPRESHLLPLTTGELFASKFYTKLRVKSSDIRCKLINARRFCCRMYTSLVVYLFELTKSNIFTKRKAIFPNFCATREKFS